MARRRSTAGEVRQRREAALLFCKDQKPVTVRQVYYHMVSRGLVPKTDAGYQRIQNDLSVMRDSGDLPYQWISDATRWQRKPKAFDRVDELVDAAASSYRKDFMRSQGVQMEVWLEKDALAGVIYRTVAQYDIPLMVSRGYASKTFLWSSAQQLDDGAIILILTDYDAAGATIARKVEEGLRKHSGGKEMVVERVALTAAQESEYDLPGRDPKSSDKKAGFDQCCDLDALEPDTLRSLVDEAISNHLDTDALASFRKVEQLERESWKTFIKGWEAL